MLLSRAVVMTTARRGTTHRGSWALFLAGTSLASPIVALCEDNNKRELVKRDAAGNIDWGKTLSQIPQGEFWDDVARAAGANVSSSTKKTVRRKKLTCIESGQRTRMFHPSSQKRFLLFFKHIFGCGYQ